MHLKVKKGSKWVTFWCALGIKWITVIGWVKFEFNDTLLCTKKNSEERQFVRVSS